MDEHLTMAAKTLARWCYAHGVDERVLGVGEQQLKAAADQALSRTASAHLEQALWQQTAALLRQRRDWDRDHQASHRRPRHACPAPWRSTTAHPRRPAMPCLRWPAAPHRRRRGLRHPPML